MSGEEKEREIKFIHDEILEMQETCNGDVEQEIAWIEECAAEYRCYWNSVHDESGNMI
jgi:hypothetical protein